VGAAVTVAITLLIVQNGDTAEVEWFLFDFGWPLWVVLLISFVGGMIGWQLFLFEIHRLHKTAPDRRIAASRKRIVARRKGKKVQD
jgi:uncharacterized integral membrane protein